MQVQLRQRYGSADPVTVLRTVPEAGQSASGVTVPASASITQPVTSGCVRSGRDGEPQHDPPVGQDRQVEPAPGRVARRQRVVDQGARPSAAGTDHSRWTPRCAGRSRVVHVQRRQRLGVTERQA